MKPLVKAAFVQVFDALPAERLSELVYGQSAEWDSLAHMRLISELEYQLGIQFAPQDILTMTSAPQIEAILEKYR